LVKKRDPSGVNWYFTDRLGSTRVLTDATGHVVVSYSWSISSSYAGWVVLYVDGPNSLRSGQASFKLTCT